GSAGSPCPSSAAWRQPWTSPPVRGSAPGRPRCGSGTGRYRRRSCRPLDASHPLLVGAQAPHRPPHVGFQAHFVDLDTGAAAGSIHPLAQLLTDRAEGLAAVVAVAHRRIGDIAHLDAEGDASLVVVGGDDWRVGETGGQVLILAP